MKKESESSPFYLRQIRFGRLPCLAVLADSVTVAGPVAEALAIPHAVA